MSDAIQHPIILAHGIARFDILRKIFQNKFQLFSREINDKLHYFKGIKSHLESHGFKVHHTNVDFAGSVVERAEQLSKQIEQILNGEESEKVHIIAHSMGGLDARRMIVDIQDMGDKVASLTTIGTPHLGTSLAEYLLVRGGSLLIEGLRPIINLRGFEDLTIQACETFNERAREQEASNNVVYQTYASSEGRDLVFLPLQASWFIINRLEGENDGLVSLKSQKWANKLVGNAGQVKTIHQFEFSTPADHLNEVGWWDPQESNPLIGWLRPTKQAEEYESKIKDIYLEIANKLGNYE